jgi:hypothetical protein
MGCRSNSRYRARPRSHARKRCRCRWTVYVCPSPVPRQCGLRQARTRSWSRSRRCARRRRDTLMTLSDYNRINTPALAGDTAVAAHYASPGIQGLRPRRSGPWWRTRAGPWRWSRSGDNVNHPSHPNGTMRCTEVGISARGRKCVLVNCACVGKDSRRAVGVIW